MRIVDSKEISEYIDWNHLNELEDLNPKHETLLVGYWKKYFDNVREHYVKNIVVDVKMIITKAGRGTQHSQHPKF